MYRRRYIGTYIPITLWYPRLVYGWVRLFRAGKYCNYSSRYIRIYILYRLQNAGITCSFILHFRLPYEFERGLFKSQVSSCEGSRNKST